MMDAAIKELEFKKVTEGLAGAEGPVFVPNGEFYMVAPEEEVDGKFAGSIVKVDLSTGEKKTLCLPNVDGYGGVPAGCQSLKDGSLYVADMRLGLLHVKLDGSFVQVATKDKDGRDMQGCNDCALDYSGRLWITAPAGPIAPSPYTRSMQEPFGSLYSYTAESGTLARLDTGIQFPNGIAVQHDFAGNPQRVLVAETPHKRIWSYDITATGNLENKRIWATLPGDHEGGPDGMDFDAKGNLLVANWGSHHVEVFGPHGGRPWIRIKCPFERPSNLHFLPGKEDIFVTEHDGHALWRAKWIHPGMPQACDQI